MQFQPTVFIVDDDQATRASLADAITSMGLPAEAYASAEQMLAAFSPDHHGCALIDLFLPGMSGLELMEHLLARQAPLGIVLFSGHAEVRAAVRAMKRGAVDFLQKPYTVEELRESVYCAMAQGTSRSNNNASPPRAMLDKLTESERQVLELTVYGTANKNIASRLGISLRTVYVRRAAVMRKLGVKNRFELVRLALQFDLQKPADLPAEFTPGANHEPI
ncbi:MAG TPA: response regulator [Pirellulales bacterium]